jgi:aminopeptidase N
MLRALNEYQTEYEYVNIAYIKPVIMYDTLRKTVGEKRFFSALKSYYENYQFKNATPDDLVGAFEKTGCATNEYFRSFFDGKALI